VTENDRKTLHVIIAESLIVVEIRKSTASGIHMALQTLRLPNKYAGRYARSLTDRMVGLFKKSQEGLHDRFRGGRCRFSRDLEDPGEMGP
jgi:hypothetical protein